MQKITWMLLLVSITTLSQDLVLTGVMDGPLANGTPKMIQLYATENIPDLSRYGLGSVTNGSGISNQEYQLSGNATKGQVLYVSKEQEGFEAFFGFSPDYISNVANINGDDAIELFYQATEEATPTVYDTYGDIHTDGTGENWEYTNGWAHREVPFSPSTVFDANQWVFSGKNALNGITNNTSTSDPFPLEYTERTLTTTHLVPKNTLIVYPNPTKNDRVFLNSPYKKALTVTIFSSIGKNLGTQKVVGDTIDLSALQTGAYLLKFEDATTTTLRRIVKN